MKNKGWGKFWGQGKRRGRQGIGGGKSEDPLPV